MHFVGTGRSALHRTDLAAINVLGVRDPGGPGATARTGRPRNTARTEGMAGPGLSATSHPGGAPASTRDQGTVPASTRDRGAARVREHVG